MAKAIKIAGVILISIIALVVLVNIFFSASRGMLSGSSSEFGGDMMGSGLPSGSISFGTGSANVKAKSDSQMMLSESAPPMNDIVVAVDKKIIKNGDLNLKVDNVDAAREKIVQIAKANQGDIFSSNIHQSKNNIKSGYVNVKVPVANFEKTFSEIKTVASLVLSESTSGQDVTEEYADLQGQLKNKQAEEQQFVVIMNQAQKIQDILDVTQQLSRVRGEIERLQGRIKFIESQTDMSTIAVKLNEDQTITVVDSWRPWQIVKESVNLLIKGLQNLLTIIIVLIIAILPFILILGAIIFLIFFYIIRKILKKFKKK